MSKDEAIKEFRRVYPEKEIFCSASKIDDEHYLIDATFPDGEFYFVVEKNIVSCSYNTKDAAISRIKKL